MNRPLLLASARRGFIAGLVAAAGGFAWVWISGETDRFILPIIAGLAVFYAATMILYFEGRKH